MLHVNDLTIRIAGRVLLDQATVAIPDGWVVGLVGRNGAGKTSLFRVILGEQSADGGGVSIPKGRRIGALAQEAPGGPESLIDTVLAADKERASLMAEAETATDPHRIAEIHTRLADIDAHSAPARAATILKGLGFDDAQQARPCSDFSGGWRMRVALGALLFSEPDLLLLDEPTNYLDLEGTIWLESFLKSYPRTCIIVSHDRDLLNRVARGIVHLDQGKLTLYSGNYDTFERTRMEKLAQQTATKAKQEAARRHMQAFVDRFRAKASKARQAQSRLKMIAKMTPIQIVAETPVPQFKFPDPIPLAPPIMRLEEVSVGYGDRVILRDLNLRIDEDDRIALLGANGNGKSTFAKLLSDRLEPMKGNKYHHKKLKVGYFAQHQLDELNPKESVYDHVRALLPDATEAQVRARAGAIGFPGERAFTAAEKLSGGEKARLALALAAFDGPHLLILDEPTNHLDIESRAALLEGLNEYAGAVILISHDPYLIEACADRLWLVANGTVKTYDGDIDDYRRDLLEEKGLRRPKDRRNDDETSRQESRRESAKARAEIAPLKRAAEAAEKRVHDITAKIEDVDKKLAAPGLFERDAEAATKLSKERANLVRALKDAEDAWLAAEAKWEDARASIA
ncbi:MAG: ATP-binding cassette domain-containing protein [Alphaproteobacteria bacterium]